jgi:catechol 2,3-dioxygenase-like lactoylglutathione lyase family enzyme
MGIRNLQVVSVPVSDQDRAKAFYVDALGFTLRRDDPMGPDQRWVEVAPPHGDTSLTLVTWFPTMPAGSLKGIVLATDNIEADYAELSRRGVAFHGPIQKEFWGTFATFDDPDGNGWVLTQDLAGA